MMPHADVPKDPPETRHPHRVVIEVSDQLGRDLEHIFGRQKHTKSIQNAYAYNAYKNIQMHTKTYKCIQKHTNVYKTVSSDQLDQD